MRTVLFPVIMIVSLAACDQRPGVGNQVGDPGRGPRSGQAPAPGVGNPGNGPSAVTGNLTVKAGAISLIPGPGGGKGISGTFEIRSARPGENSVANASDGGACLLAQVPSVSDGKCTTDMQCDIRVQNGVLETKWRGYCLGDSGDTASKRCWFRPEGNVCVRHVGAGSHTIPAFDPSPVHRKFGRKPVQWKVYGCLNGPYDEKAKATAPCAGGQGVKLYDHGTPKVVQP